MMAGKRLAEPTVDPMEAWRAFKQNTLMWARVWLETGELPPTCHFVMVEKLAPWIAAVTAGGPEIRAALLNVVPPIPPREPEPKRAWVVPALGQTYSIERETDETEQVDEQSTAETLEAPEKPISAGRGGVTREPADVRQPPAPVTHQEAVIAFPLPEGTRECAACGRAFKPYRKEAAFCSGRCRQKAYRERKSGLVEAAE
jgi:hypothetical protein